MKGKPLIEALQGFLDDVTELSIYDIQAEDDKECHSEQEVHTEETVSA